MKRKLSPLPYEAGECSSSGSRRPGHPHSTPWSCERVKTKLTTYVMQDSSLLCPRQYHHAPLLCRGALCRNSHPPDFSLSIYNNNSLLVNLCNSYVCMLFVSCCYNTYDFASRPRTAIFPPLPIYVTILQGS